MTIRVEITVGETQMSYNTTATILSEQSLKLLFYVSVNTFILINQEPVVLILGYPELFKID